jgi:hypothetical protein
VTSAWVPTSLLMIPEGITALVSITNLGLNDNRLSTLPPPMAFMTKLQVLSAMDNRLVYLAPDIGKLSSLKLLNLTNNPDLMCPPPEVCKCCVCVGVGVVIVRAGARTGACVLWHACTGSTKHGVDDMTTPARRAGVEARRAEHPRLPQQDRLRQDNGQHRAIEPQPRAPPPALGRLAIEAAGIGPLSEPACVPPRGNRPVHLPHVAVGEMSGCLCSMREAFVGISQQVASSKQQVASSKYLLVVAKIFW